MLQFLADHWNDIMAIINMIGLLLLGIKPKKGGLND